MNSPPPPPEKKGFFSRLFQKKDVPQNAEQAPEEEKPEEEQAKEEPQNQQEEAKPLSFFARLKRGMRRSSQVLTSGLSTLLGGKKPDAETLQDLEDLLIRADFGVETSVAIVEKIGQKRYETLDAQRIREVLSQEIEHSLKAAEKPFPLEQKTPGKSPYIVVFVGVNGTGKTSTIGKLAARFQAQGQNVLLAAGDTFRAAAVEQLQIWGERAHTRVIARPQGSDPGGLVFDAVKTAIDEQYDVLLIDTAGRLHNRRELMAELEKIIRVIKKHDPTAPQEVILTLDAGTGQNALTQVDLFRETANVTGLVITKLDGSACGGILVPITVKHQLPVYFIGVGETKDDILPFNAADFARALVGIDE